MTSNTRPYCSRCNCLNRIPLDKRKDAIYCSLACSQYVRGLKYSRSHKEAETKKTVRWQKENPEWVKKYSRMLYSKQKQLVFDHYGRQCNCPYNCTETNVAFLVVDHINNNGAKQRKSGVTTIYAWLVRNNFPKGYQILCANCNAAKQYNGSCHKDSHNVMQHKSQ